MQFFFSDGLNDRTNCSNKNDMFGWDDQKNKSNVAKHGISLKFAKLIFSGLVVTAIDSRADYGETREISIGVAERVAILTVVHTDRKSVCRIISARPALQRERQGYEQAIREASLRS